MVVKKNKGANPGKYVDTMGTVGTIGLHMVSHPAVGAVAGYFLDDWLGTKPWMFIIFLILGVIAGFKAVYADTKKVMRNQEREDNERFQRKD
ncbi:AtpZ/AtpI family protein [Halodesulfovibrio sp.]|jgi:ATP synthase protein I|uniref:AtpZ/AtpI family protein n=1 Tax=Halodesulfovibrio sp. TaxID=1912772 RepID=UPI0025FE41AC|nr:AtpZ/AtpI family protein [Halodesulfovibrio sp.]MCT4534629.1 AtpZ/AtpI family protein [Halodesulfovibrio sp.]MCT4628233.1 AtpZ/AtpI family protein [Halodesulfovibrio sp.]